MRELDFPSRNAKKWLIIEKAVNHGDHSEEKMILKNVVRPRRHGGHAAKKILYLDGETLWFSRFSQLTLWVIDRKNIVLCFFAVFAVPAVVNCFF